MPTTDFVGQIGDMDAADEGRDVVFAMRVELDVAQHDDIVIAANFVEGARQGFGRVFVIAEKYSRKALATRLGVSSRPSRSGLSPAQARRTRTAASASS